MRMLLGWALAAAVATGGPAPRAAHVGQIGHVPAIRSAVAAPPGWRVGAREDVDLWLHGFAMLVSDTGRVPFFARNYRQDMQAVRAQRGIVTLLDANREALQARFTQNPALTNAQFLAMYFPSFQEIQNATDVFVRSGGDPRAGNDPAMQQELAILASMFPAPADRNWLRLFVQSLRDEDAKFYHAYWTAEQQTRGAAYAQFETRWLSTYYAKISRFLNNTEQASGEVLLSLPLDGEGRTVNDAKQSNIIAVEYPRSADSAVVAFYAVAHEAVARIADEAIADNTSPAEKRSGAANGYTGNAAVRGGALLMARIAPDLAPGYMRFYIATARGTPPAGDPTAAFDSMFPLPQAIIDDVGKQIDIVLSGI